MSLRILLIGEFYSENLGDGVISENVKYHLDSEIENLELQIIDLSGRLGYKSKDLDEITLQPSNSTYQLKKKLRTGEGLINRVYDKIVYHKFLRKNQGSITIIDEQLENDYDIAIFAGGQLIMDYFLVYIEHIMNYLNANNIPVIFNGIGFGKIYSSVNRKKFLDILEYPNVKLISVRDSSTEINEKILSNNRIKANLTADPALWSSDTYSLTKNYASKIIGIGVIFRDDPVFMKNQSNLIKNIINKLEEQHVDWEIFTNGDYLDYKYAKNLYKTISNHNKKIADRPTTPRELVQLISSYRSIISFRLHSHIIATALHIPSIGIYWDDKVTSFFKKFEAQERVFKVNDDSDIVVKKLLSILDNPLSDHKLELEKNLSKETLLNGINDTISSDK